jgi:hypothetical protein
MKLKILLSRLIILINIYSIEMIGKKFDIINSDDPSKSLGTLQFLSDKMIFEKEHNILNLGIKLG